jgi:signal transduction histidine kinase
LKENIAEVNNLQSLSDSLLQLAQYQSQHAHHTFKQVELHKIVQDAVNKVDHLAKRKSISIETKTLTHTILGSQLALTDVFIILLDNAIKYSPTKSTITIAAKRTDGHVAISVTDRGIGISPKDLPHIFDRFYRADSARSKSDINGYGLGLSIAKQIVKAHRGTITAISTKPKGTTITVTIPAKKSIS